MLTTREATGYAVVCPLGEQDLANREVLAMHLRRLRLKRQAVIVDLGDTSFADVGFVRVLAEAARQAAEDGLAFVVVVPGGPSTLVTRMVLDYVPLGPTVRVTSSLEAAVALVRARQDAVVTPPDERLAERVQAARRAAWAEAARARRLARERDLLAADVHDNIDRCRQTIRALRR